MTLTPKTIRFVLPFICLLAFQFSSKAAHLNGTEITYRNIDTLTFELTVVAYRECGGNSFGNPSSGTFVVCSTSGKSKSVNLRLVSVTEIRAACDTFSNGLCDSINKAKSGTGIERIIYRDTIDFRIAKYDSLLSSGCTQIRFETGQCCRSSSITNGAASTTSYNYATLDLGTAPFNSSPIFTTDPVLQLCCNQNMFHSIGGIDTLDFDSLSFGLVKPKSSWTKTVTTSNPPITVYYPGTLKYPYTNPNSNPPIGLYLDPETGDLIFTPTKCGEVVAFVLEITEWRKDSKGKQQPIGRVRRDLTYNVTTCNSNNPPVIKGPFNKTVCEGSTLCFTITTEDKVRKPPPPLPTPDADTSDISWDGGIPGASFDVLSDTVLNQSARFCWTPSIGQARALPYRFTVTTRDNNCPRNAVASRTFQVKVNPAAKAKTRVDSLGCGRYAIQSIPDSNLTKPARYMWRLKDTSGVILFDKTYGYIESTGAFISSKQYDTLQFRKGGTYLLEHTIDNGPKCPTATIDTIVVPPLLEVNLIDGSDTFVCAGSTLTLTATVINGVKPISYQWRTGDTTSSMNITMPTGVTDSVFYVTITDQTQCKANDSALVFLRDNPFVSITSDKRICTYDTIHLVPTDSLARWDDPRDTAKTTVSQGDTLYKKWYLDGKLLSEKEELLGVHTPGKYTITVTDSLGCMASDSMVLAINDTVKANVSGDLVLCWNDNVKLIATGLDTVGNSKTGTYRWWDITDKTKKINMGLSDTLTYSIQSSTTFQLDLFVTEGKTTCYDSDTVSVTVNALPVVRMPNDMVVCFDAGNVNLRLGEDSNASGGWWSCPAKPSLVINGYIIVLDSSEASIGTKIYQIHYEFTDTSTGCVKLDSFELKINPLPRVKLRDGYFCQDKEVVNLKTDKIIVLPGGGTLALGRQAWKCIDCGTFKESDIIEDLGTGVPGTPQDFVLNIDTKAIPLGTKTTAVITIEFEFRSVFGCYNRDTAKIGIGKVPKVNFNAFPDLCWNAGIVDLKVLSNVTPNDGIWKAIDSTGYASHSGINNVIKGDTFNGDTLNTLLTPKPAEGSNFTYMMRYFHNQSGCPAFRDTTLTIRGIPVPLINHTDLQVNSMSEPYQLCEFNSDILLTANYSGGTWYSDNSNALSGSTFTPGNVTTNNPFYIHYAYVDIYGCQGLDSVQVEIHQRQTIILSPDTAITWTPNWSIDVSATYANSTGVTWVPLTGGQVSNDRSPNTTFSATGKSDSIIRYLLYASTNQGAGAVCPYANKTMQIFVHPTPCMEFDMDYVVSSRKLKLTPGNLNMKSFRWEVEDTASTDVNPTFDVSNAKDSIIPVKLTAFNELGDSCVQVMRLNVITGSVKDLQKQLKIYPNPVGNGFAIEFDGYLKGDIIQIFNTSGARVMDRQMTTKWVDCQNLTTGVYTFVIHHDRQTYVGRFVKK